MILILTALVVVILIFLSLFYIKNKKSIDPSIPRPPPGPWGFPILGHFPLLGAEPYKKLLEWKKIYGPAISVRFGSLPAVVLIDDKLIKEAFSLYELSDRPPTKHFSKITYGLKGLIFGAADSSLEQRHFIIRNLRDLGLGRQSMEEKIREEIVDFMKELEDEVKSMPGIPGSSRPIVMNHRFKASVVSSFWSIFMSHRFDSQDPKFKEILEWSKTAMQSPGVLGEMASFMPWLAELIPGISGLTKRVEAFHKVYAFAEEEIQKHGQTRVSGQPRDFTDAYLDMVDATTDPMSTFHKSQNFQPITTGDIFFGALDTTSAALEWLMVHLVRNPELQQKIFEEVSRVTSMNSRLPCLSDRPMLAYTDAVVHELIRVSTVGALGLLHHAMEDVVVQNYVIPKGSMVIGNLYGIHHDPDVHEDPEVFKPERFLEERDDQQQQKGRRGLCLKKKVDGYLPFSHGKRFCPGKSQAMDSLFLFTACLCQKFEFHCWKNDVPSLDIVHGMVSFPKEFHVKVTLRSSSSASS